MQYTQQALQRILVDALSKDFILRELIGFDDQEPNQLLAREGSLSGALATLDLSEASDRVVNRHVIDMMGHAGQLAKAVQACRSTRADVRGEVINLTKYASMGSALTFPIEAMMFLTFIVMGISQDLGRPLTTKDLYGLRGKVRVYGDDIIVPVEHVPSVIRVLEAHSLKVNSDKSFWSGSFRESCGKEYYMGQDVSIVKVRAVPPTSRKDAEGIVSTVSTRNQFYLAGMWNTARWLDDRIERLIPFPITESTSPLLGRTSFLSPYQADEFMCINLQRPLVKGARMIPTLPVNSLDGPGALLKWFLYDGDEPLSKDHLEVSGRPNNVRIINCWGPKH